MTEPSDRLATISRWVQQADDGAQADAELLYRPDGLAQESDGAIIVAPSRFVTGMVEASHAIETMETMEQAMGRVGQVAEALCAAINRDIALDEDDAEDAVSAGESCLDEVPWRPMPRGNPLYEAWAAAATEAQLEVCRAARMPYPIFAAMLAACAPQRTAQELRAQLEAALQDASQPIEGMP